MTTSKSLGRNSLQAIALFAAILIATAIIYVDILLLDSNLGEQSLVEFSQAGLILLSAVFFALGARRQPEQRGYLALVSTLFLCMFLREQDALFDNIYHGFWRVPVAVVAISGLIIVVLNRATFRSSLHRHAQDPSFWIILIGVFLLIVFSRLFGSGQLWHNVPDQPGLAGAKTVVQECTELMSYALICLGSYLSHRYGYGED